MAGNTQYTQVRQTNDSKPAPPKAHKPKQMASKRKPVVITITKTRRKTQPFTFSIDMPGNAAKQTKAEYYTRSTTARVGALRQCGAMHGYGSNFVNVGWFVKIKGHFHPVEFISVNLAKK